MSAPKLSFALGKPKPKAVPAAAPALSRPSAFGALGDEAEDSVDAAPTASSSKGSTSAFDANRRLAAQAPTQKALSKSAKARMEAEMAVDPTVYEYDEVWDRMKEAKTKAKAVKEEADVKREPKYINSLLTSAATRKLDHLRAEEKMIQREREAEGDEFADKDKFVTQAYKDQMAELRRAEEEEKKREELERAKSRNTGMTHFYRDLLERSNQEHTAAVAASSTSVAVKGPTLPDDPAPNLTIARPLKKAAQSDALMAALAQEDGKDVELNDSNEIVDKRELLSAGLNLSAPNTRRLGGLRSGRSAPNPEGVVDVHRAAGAAATKKEIRERQQRLLEQQMAEEKKRIAEERERAEEEERERIVRKRNGEDEVKSARERYLERKRRKLNEDTNEETSGGI